MPPGGSVATTGSYVVTIDGSSAMARSVEGGTPVGQVVVIPRGAGMPANKTIGTLKYEDIRLELGMSMGQPMIDWINALLSNKHERKQGQITYGDINRRARAHMDFRDALLTAFGIPASDASSKEAAYFSIGMTVQETSRRAGDGGEIPSVNVKQKAFLPSNFKLTIGDLPTTRVSKIDALSFTCKVQSDDVGHNRLESSQPGATETPDLAVTFAAADEKGWDKWFDDFCVKGNNGDDRELAGNIEWLDAAGKRLAVLQMEHIGIFALGDDDDTPAGTEAVRRKKARLYFESARFTIG